MGSASVWDKEGAVEELKKLRNAGLSASRIAAAISFKFNHDISRNAVLGKLDRMGLGLLGTVRDGHRVRKPRKARAERRASPQPQRISPLRRALEMAPEPMPFAIVEEIVVPEKERVGVEGLGPHQCRWPINDPQSPDFHFCHRKQVGGTSYCEVHLRRAYQPLPPPKPRHSIVNASNPMPVRVKEDA